MPLHTFLPSSTEVLPLPLAVPVVAAMVVSLVVMVRLLPLDAPLFLMTPLLVPIAAGHLRLRVCGSLGDKVRFARGRVRGSLLENLRATASPLRLSVPVALVEDVRLVSGWCWEVLSPSEARRHGSQEVVCMRSPDQTWLKKRQERLFRFTAGFFFSH